MESLARRALLRSRALGWQLPDLSAQLRIATIDSFCRELAIQQPLLSGLGSDLPINENPQELYRRAARQNSRTISSGADPALAAAIEDLLLWRDNGWNELESLLVEMLGQRDRWMQRLCSHREPIGTLSALVLNSHLLELFKLPFAELDHLFDQLPGARDEAMQLVRFACRAKRRDAASDLAELAEIPRGPLQLQTHLKKRARQCSASQISF